MPRRNRAPKHVPYVDSNVCGLKRRYPTRTIAEAAAKDQELTDRKLELFVYECVRCKRWHLTRKETEI